jgi:hypothetical protein
VAIADDSRSEGALRTSERDQLVAFLDDNRDEMLAVVESLTDEQARRRLVPSLTSPLAILKHAVFVEKVWFDVAIGGCSRQELGIPEEAADSWLLDDRDTIASLVAEYHVARSEADALASGLGLDDLAMHNRRGPLSLRWIFLHMIEELSRHAGHGDILREQILAAERGHAQYDQFVSPSNRQLPLR